MIGFNGGLIGKDRTTTAVAASGVWTLNEQIKAKRNFIWPTTDGDPDYASVTLLLHADGTNGSTTIVDNSPTPKTITASGNAQISTLQSKFGGASLLFDGNGDYVRGTDTGFAFGTGDFTVELWVYAASIGGYQTVIATRTDASTYTDRWTIAVGPNGQVVFYTNTFVVTTSNNVISTNTWTYVAASRSGTNLRVFINGTQSGSTATNSQNLTHTTLAVGAASGGGTEYFNGYIDEVRVTKGVARYTANFTAPTLAFPNF